MAVRIAVVGGGAAGMFAVITAAGEGAEVTLFERGERLGLKLGITGKGRCNLTNNCAPDEFLRSVPTNPRFLYSAINSFSPADTIAYFESLGVPLKTERGGRVFPVSDKASDIVNALRREVGRSCRVVHERVTGVAVDGGAVTGLRTASGPQTFDRVIIATGGLSYKSTGSDGDGLRFARELGLAVTPTKPSLVPLETVEGWCADAMGLSLKNTGLKITDTVTGKVVYDDFGELLFTHFGLSGPMVLSASAYLPQITPGRYKISLDLKPALDFAALDTRILSDFAKYKNRDFGNALSDLLPLKLIPVIVGLSGVDFRRKVNSITKTERAALAALLKGLTCTVKCARPIDEAIVTSGGVSVAEFNPRTMECKRIKGLYFAGEVIDVDAYTGGFNLQIAFATGRAAGRAACLG